MHRMPLEKSLFCDTLPVVLAKYEAKQAFPHGRASEAAYAGMLLFFGRWQEAHEKAQEISSPEGSYWHAILHRQEPDDGNASYWYRQVGKHPTFPALQQDAQKILDQHPQLSKKLSFQWDPMRFLSWCEEARQNRGSLLEQAVMEIQHAEWLRLFLWCARPPS